MESARRLAAADGTFAIVFAPTSNAAFGGFSTEYAGSGFSKRTKDLANSTLTTISKKQRALRKTTPSSLKPRL
jgi:hypothetical protein